MEPLCCLLDSFYIKSKYHGRTLLIKGYYWYAFNNSLEIIHKGLVSISICFYEKNMASFSSVADGKYTFAIINWFFLRYIQNYSIFGHFPSLHSEVETSCRYPPANSNAPSSMEFLFVYFKTSQGDLRVYKENLQ